LPIPSQSRPRKNTTARQTALDGPSRRERILDAAERLFAEGGFDGVSMRAVAAAAGVGVPLIVYHFGSKQGMYRAIFERYRSVLDARLAALRSAPGAGQDPLEHIVRAFVQPVLQTHASARGRLHAQLIAREATDPRTPGRGIARDYFDPVATEFIRAIGQALPQQSAEYAHWAYFFAVGALVMSVFDGRVQRISGGQVQTEDLERKAQYLIAFITAGIRAGRDLPP